jgi:NAD(P)-dependent dehydrogenase (short-subunit alcohol dehydrogenase family)
MASERRLEGRVAVVTGAGGTSEGLSIGRAIAVVLARHGARVAVVDLDVDAADFTVKEIADGGGEACRVIADVTTDPGCERAVASAVDEWGRLDVLVNNVGLTGPGAAVADVDTAVWDRLLDVNLKSTLLMSKFAIPTMASGGVIVNISSLSAMRPGMATGYAVAKGGVETLTRATALQYGPQGIRVNCVSPGPMWTPIVSRAYPPDEREERRERRRLQTALEVEGTAWDAASAVLFFASDDAKWITGQVLTVDGGASLH